MSKKKLMTFQLLKFMFDYMNDLQKKNNASSRAIIIKEVIDDFLEDLAAVDVEPNDERVISTAYLNLDTQTKIKELSSSLFHCDSEVIRFALMYHLIKKKKIKKLPVEETKEINNFKTLGNPFYHRDGTPKEEIKI